MIFPVIIKYKSRDYEEMVALRHKILRQPLGLNFSEEDLLPDEKDILLGLSAPRPRRIAACCILSPVDDRTVKLRQMAVDDIIQKSGLGKNLLSFAELIAKKEDFKIIILHAREVAVDFYKKNGYEIKGEEFTEVGISHYKMTKLL